MRMTKYTSPKPKIGYPPQKTTKKHFNHILDFKNTTLSLKTTRKHFLLRENSVVTISNAFVKIKIYKYPPLELLTHHIIIE